MRRYKFLLKEDIHDALNRVRDALLAASDGNDVEQIMKGVLTFDERMKIGRRILIAEYLLQGLPFHEITRLLKVGKTTIVLVSKNLDEYAKCFELINEVCKLRNEKLSFQAPLITSRGKKVESEYKNKSYRSVGGPTKIFKIKEYTGFTRKNVKR